MIGLKLFEIKLKPGNKNENNKVKERIAYKSLNGVSDVESVMFITLEKKKIKMMEDVIATRTIISYYLKNKMFNLKFRLMQFFKFIKSS